ncbi:MAG: hypothetical protein Q6373_001775 [Candidatus Sigynarchaeota archaeon]
MRSKIGRSWAIYAILFLWMVLWNSIMADMQVVVAIAFSIPIIIKAAIYTITIIKRMHIKSISLQGSAMRLSYKWVVSSAVTIPLKEITSIGVDAGDNEKSHVLRIHYNKRVIFSTLEKNSRANLLVRVPLPPSIPFFSEFLSRWIGSIAPPRGYIAGRLEYAVIHVIALVFFLFFVYFFCWIICTGSSDPFKSLPVIYGIGNVVAFYYAVFVFPIEKFLFPLTLDD